MPWVLIVPLVVGVLAAAGAGYVLVQANLAKKGLVDYILSHPESTGVVAYTVDENGLPKNDGLAVARSPERRLVLGSSMKLIVLAAYADAISQGELDPNETISVPHWERYYLPNTDGGAHVSGLKSLGLEADELGYAIDQSAQVSLADLMRCTIHYSGNASTDVLMERLGPGRMVQTLSLLGMRSHDSMTTALSAALALLNHEQEGLRVDYIRSVVLQVRAGDTSEPDRLQDLYLNDPEWKAAQINHLTQPEGADGVTLADVWPHKLVGVQLQPRGTAEAYAHLMAAIGSDSTISARRLFYGRYGNKSGVTAGATNLAAYAVPKRGPAKGKLRSVVLFVNDLPLDLWNRQMRWLGFYLLQRDLARGTGAFRKLA